MTEIDEILFSEEEITRAEKEALSNPLIKKFLALYNYYNSSYVDELERLKYDVTFRLRELRKCVRDGKLSEKDSEVSALIDFIISIPNLKKGLDCLKSLGGDEVTSSGKAETPKEKHDRLFKGENHG